MYNSDEGSKEAFHQQVKLALSIPVSKIKGQLQEAAAARLMTGCAHMVVLLG